MYALINYKGNQFLLEEGKKIKIPYQKDLKIGSTLNFDQVIFFDDGKKKLIGNPFLKSTNFPLNILFDKINFSFEETYIDNKKRWGKFRVY